MTLVLQPQNVFTIVHQIPNHLDSSVNYVQAVIRNAYTDDIIETVRLTDKGGQRFKYDWRVPADSSGQGFYISIVTSVYTDSGYTTKNQNYGDDENTYLVQERVRLNGIGGGDSGVDSFDIRRIFTEEFSKVKEDLIKLDQEEDDEEEEVVEVPMRWDEVLNSISELGKILSKEKPDDYSSILNLISEAEARIIQQIKDCEAEEPEKIDLEPVMNALSDISQSIVSKADELQESFGNSYKEDEMRAKLDTLKSLLSDPEIKRILNPALFETVKEPETPPRDINKLHS